MTMRVAYFARAFFGESLSDRLADLGIELVPFVDADQLKREAEICDALVFPEPFYNPALIELLLPRKSPVKLIQLSSAGIETVVKYGVPSGIRVANAANVWGPTVSEHAATLAMAALRRINEMERARQQAKWVKGAFITAPGQPEPEGIIPRMGTMEGANVGIVGYGLIGAGVAARLKAFGAVITGYARTPRELPHADRVLTVSELADTIGELDVFISCLPSTPETDGMIDGKMLSRFKDNVTIVNVGRGSTFDDDAFIEWLRSHPRAIAALDVFQKEPLPSDHPFWSLENVIISPHVAAYGGRMGVERLVALCRANLQKIEDGSELKNAVGNLPILERN